MSHPCLANTQQGHWTRELQELQKRVSFQLLLPWGPPSTNVPNTLQAPWTAGSASYQVSLISSLFGTITTSNETFGIFALLVTNLLSPLLTLSLLTCIQGKEKKPSCEFSQLYDESSPTVTSGQLSTLR